MEKLGRRGEVELRLAPMLRLIPPLVQTSSSRDKDTSTCLPTPILSPLPFQFSASSLHLPPALRSAQQLFESPTLQPNPRSHPGTDPPKSSYSQTFCATISQVEGKGEVAFTLTSSYSTRDRCGVSSPLCSCACVDNVSISAFHLDGLLVEQTYVAYSRFR